LTHKIQALRAGPGFFQRAAWSFPKLRRAVPAFIEIVASVVHQGVELAAQTCKNPRLRGRGFAAAPRVHEDEVADPWRFAQARKFHFGLAEVSRFCVAKNATRCWPFTVLEREMMLVCKNGRAAKRGDRAKRICAFKGAETPTEETLGRANRARESVRRIRRAAKAVGRGSCGRVGRGGGRTPGFFEDGTMAAGFRPRARAGKWRSMQQADVGFGCKRGTRNLVRATCPRPVCAPPSVSVGFSQALVNAARALKIARFAASPVLQNQQKSISFRNQTVKGQHLASVATQNPRKPAPRSRWNFSPGATPPWSRTFPRETRRRPARESYSRRRGILDVLRGESQTLVANGTKRATIS